MEILVLLGQSNDQNRVRHLKYTLQLGFPRFQAFEEPIFKTYAQ